MCNSDAEMPRGERPVFYKKHCAIGLDIEEHPKGKKYPNVIKWHGAQYDVKWIIAPTEIVDVPVKIKSVDARLNGEVTLVDGSAFFNPQKKTMFDYSALNPPSPATMDPPHQRPSFPAVFVSHTLVFVFVSVWFSLSSLSLLKPCQYWLVPATSISVLCVSVSIPPSIHPPWLIN